MAPKRKAVVSRTATPTPSAQSQAGQGGGAGGSDDESGGVTGGAGVDTSKFKSKSRLGVNSGRRKNLKQILQLEKFEKLPVNVATYSSIEASPPFVTRKKYCDITGLPANYTDPKTRLQYHSVEVFRYIQQLQPHLVQQHLALRGAEVKLN